jgi:hypothetical protein|tara:strand:- start:569 stop:1213 length:645 start_codon:yes stop_codon:yes gene_type:complete
METFDPVDYSLAENQFFLKHLGESPVVALQEALPTGVSAAAVRDVLGKVYELDELKKHRDKDWVGVRVIQTAIRVFLHEWEKWRDLNKRGAPRWPTLHAWDGKGRPHRGGIGSDSAKIVSYLDENGKRHRFAVPLHGNEGETFVPPWMREPEPLPTECVLDVEKGFMQCPVDSWATNFNPDSRQSQNMARARMAKHCRSSKDERVREFGLKVFG